MSLSSGFEICEIAIEDDKKRSGEMKADCVVMDVLKLVLDGELAGSISGYRPSSPQGILIGFHSSPLWSSSPVLLSMLSSQMRCTLCMLLVPWLIHQRCKTSFPISTLFTIFSGPP
jgi:hypothetical protein